MKGKKCKKMVGKMVVIAAVLMMGMGLQTAHAGDLFTSAVYAVYSGASQGYAEYYAALGFYYDTPYYSYDAWLYMEDALWYSGEAYYYAGFVGGDWAYYAWLYADEAYWYFYDAEYYAYLAYIYGDYYNSALSVVYGGLGAASIAYAEAYAGIGCYGGYY